MPVKSLGANDRYEAKQTDSTQPVGGADICLKTVIFSQERQSQWKEWEFWRLESSVSLQQGQCRTTPHVSVWVSLGNFLNGPPLGQKNEKLLLRPAISAERPTVTVSSHSLGPDSDPEPVLERGQLTEARRWAALHPSTQKRKTSIIATSQASYPHHSKH